MSLPLLAYLLLQTALVLNHISASDPVIFLTLAAWVIALLAIGRDLEPTRGLFVIVVVQAIGASLLATTLPARIIPVALVIVAWFRRPWLGICLFALLGAVQIPAWQANETPGDWDNNDVRYFQHAAAAEQMAGRNPYSATYDNIYHPSTAFYGDALIRDGRVVSFPYPPLNLVVNVLGHLCGDVRWPMWLAVAGGAAFVLLAGRELHPLSPGNPGERVGVRGLNLGKCEDPSPPTPLPGTPGRGESELALFAILTQPMNEEMLRRAWTEPLLFLTMAFCLWTLTTRSHLLRIVGIAALISAKQYAVLALPVLWLCAGVTLVEIAGACAVALALVLPWLVNDPVGVWRGCVVFHIENTFRIDATAVPAWMLYRLGIRIPTSLAFVVVALTFAWIARRRPTGLAQATLALVAVLLGFFVWNKAAFLNYYWFTATLLLTTIPLAVAETSQKCDNVR